MVLNPKSIRDILRLLIQLNGQFDRSENTIRANFQKSSKFTEKRTLGTAQALKPHAPYPPGEDILKMVEITTDQTDILNEIHLG